MAKKILMNVAEGDECRVAVIEDGKLYEYFVDRPSQLKHLGNIYKGVVSNVEPGIQAAFVDIGLERNGFLHVSDTLSAYGRIDSVTELYRPVSRRAGERPAAPPPPARHAPTSSEVADEPGYSDVAVHGGAETRQDETSQAEETPQEQTRTEPEFLDRLNDVAPGHNVTHSPAQAMHDGVGTRGADSMVPSTPAHTAHESGRYPVVQQPVQQLPDVVPGVVSEHNELGESAATTSQRRKRRPPPEILKAAPAPAVDFKLPPPPKKRTRRITANSVEGPPGETAPVDHDLDDLPDDTQADFTERDAAGTYDRDGNRTDGGGAGPDSSPISRFIHPSALPKIQNMLRRDQEVLVQVTKASQGGKGPGLSTYLSLPGRYMVLMPNSSKGGVSRKIEDPAQRDALRKILDALPVPDDMGVVVRTAAIGRTYDELERDLNYLLRLWNVIVEQIRQTQAPALVYADSDPALRAVRDYFTADMDEIVIDDRASYERVVAFFDSLMPNFRDRVKLYEGEVPLFYAEGIETQIDHVFDKKVPLPSGGYLYIEQTEALVAIDVNSGKFTSAGDAERTAYLTNLEAIPEICRQLRLRDLGGIIVNDLIDMMSASHRNEVENALRRELHKDRARTKVARMSPFGVIEMTRQRVRPSIKTYTYVECPTCRGFGHVRSAETLCLSLLREMKLALSDDRVTALTVQIHPHVLSHLHSEFRADVDQLESSSSKKVIFEYARDLVLGERRFFYINDREARVLYDLDARINGFVDLAEQTWVSRSNVPLPPASLGVSGAQPQDKPGRERRRGGRRERDRRTEKMQQQKQASESNRNVPVFGAGMPDLPELPEAAADAPAGPPKVFDRGGRRGRRGRDRHGRPDAPPRPASPQQQGQPAPTSNNGQPVAATNGQPTPANGQPGQQPGQPGQPGQGRRRRGRRGGRGRRRDRQGMPQGQQPGQGQSAPQQGQAVQAQQPAEPPAPQPAPNPPPAPTPVVAAAPSVTPAAEAQAPKTRSRKKSAEKVVPDSKTVAEKPKKTTRKKTETTETKKPAAKKTATKKPAAKKAAKKTT